MSLARCIARIDARDAEVRGWCHIDRSATGGSGPLAGLVVGVKDVVDVAGMPTTHGSPIFAGAIAQTDAPAIVRLRSAGAVILGKTVTAEFATYHPGPTVNPRKPGHTPGGSSSGSAAVVADGQADIAIGTQTAGSVIRPASFCGVIGFKPTFGRYPLGGVLETAPSLDTLGLFARTLAILDEADAVVADDPARPAARARLRIGLCRTPAWPLASAEMQAAFDGFAETLRAAGLPVSEVQLPEPFDRLGDAQALIHRHEAYQAMGHIRRDHPDEVSQAFRAMIDAGAAESPADYAAARALQQQCTALLDGVFADVDLLLAPGAPGVAPEGLTATGDPAFQRIWTATGVPCLGFPATWRADGLPLGLQLVAMRGADRQLIADADAILAHAPLREM